MSAELNPHPGAPIEEAPLPSALRDRLDKALPVLAGVVALAAAAYLAAAWAVGAEATWEAMVRLGAGGLAAGTLVASATYLVRWWRWRVLLLGGAFGRRLPPLACLRIYLAGLALGPTPGKLGETLRSAFLLPWGVRVRESLAAFFADRLSDLIAMATLGVAAAWWLHERAGALELLWWLVVAAALLLCALGRRMPQWLQRRRRLARWASPVSTWARAWTWPRALACVAAGLVAYATQGLVLAAYVAAVGEALPAARCVLIFASATLLGAASGIPGGLGVMEAALVWQLQQAGVEPGAALAASLLLRLSTLWTAVLIGSFALAGLAHRERAHG